MVDFEEYRRDDAVTPTEAEYRWRVYPQRALLLPPGDGPLPSDLVSEAPSDVVGSTQWLTELARRVRNGEVSPESAILAACFSGERREATYRALEAPSEPRVANAIDWLKRKR